MTDTSTMKTWLITGGTGFIGRALIAELQQQNHPVIVLSRNVDKAQALLGKGVRVIESLDDIDSLDAIHSVVNLAGEPLFGGLWTKKRKQAFYDSRINTTHDLIALMERLKAKPAVMISGSAIGYYGMDPDTDFTEESPAGTDEMASLCQAWEQAALKATALGVRLVLLRTGLVMDPAGGMLQPLMVSAKFCLGAKLGDGQQWMSWISRKDMVRLILFAANQPAIAGPLNATSPTPITQETFINALAKKLGRPRVFRIPGLFLKLLVGDMAPMLLEGQKVLPAKAQKAGFTFETTVINNAFD